MNNQQILDKMKGIVIKAGQLIVTAEDRTVAREKEGSANFVTKYDSMVQSYLMNELRAFLPNASFLGEEDGQTASPATDDLCFIIDPIDGTTNFICGFQYSGISVALSVGGTLTYGVVYNPFRNELFSARLGHGAFLNDKPIHCKDTPLSGGVTIFGTAPYRADLRPAAFALAQEISYHTMDLREPGAASLNFCYVAAGRAVAFASPQLCTWDYAAAAVILQEAGGVLGDFSGEPLNFRTKIPVVASAPTGFKEFIEVSKNYSKSFN